LSPCSTIIFTRYYEFADASSLGKKLMEKMGWSSGKGLGKDEQGDTEHIAVKYKNDSKGKNNHSKL
jgi:G-patch domain